MTSDRAAAYLWDACRAGERILRFTAERSFDDYKTDEMLRSAVERQFEIVGEALACLRRHDPGLAASIPDLPDAVAFRNLLIHGYARINNAVVWRAIENSLPVLLAQLTRLLSDLGG